MKHYIIAILAVFLLLSPKQATCEAPTQQQITEWRTNAAQGNADAQFKLGVLYNNGAGVIQDDVEALKLFQLAAAQGNAGAQYSLGVMFENGIGVRQDYAEAVKWYRLAAEQGLAVAQYNLGAVYSTGRGVRQDYTLAKEWFGKACDNGYQKGCDAYRKYNQFGVQ
jgi:uncharacterized protein